MASARLIQARANPDESRLSAWAAGLRYANAAVPGIRRHRRGRGFAYVDAAGLPITNEDVLRRINALAIPPAWRDVWICADARGHLQAVGVDSRGRRQYRYHAKWRAVRDTVKFDRLVAFGDVLPTIRAAVNEALDLPGLPLRRVQAIVVRLLDVSSMRIGNDAYANENHSFGLTTLRNWHLKKRGRRLCLEFRGKSGKEHRVLLQDPQLVRLVKRCRDLPGYPLFQFVDEKGTRGAIQSDDVNAFLRDVSGADFTSKDFRTWNGTVLAAGFLGQFPPAPSEDGRKHQVVEAIESVARCLGNTPAVCRKAYVHPVLFDAHVRGELCDVPSENAAEQKPPPDNGLSPRERWVLQLLRRHQLVTGPVSRRAA